MTLRLSRLHFPVTALGPGLRGGIWFQGCRIRCRGCMSLDTWAEGRGTERTVDWVVERLATHVEVLDGVTISGGEPFEQAAGLGSLLRALRDRLPTADILVYSGMATGVLMEHHADVVAMCDTLITGPFESDRAGAEHWRGSTNQELVVVSQRGRERIEPWVRDPEGHHLQFGLEAGAMWVIGIPRPDDLQHISTRLAAGGVRVERAAWQRGSGA